MSRSFFPFTRSPSSRKRPSSSSQNSLALGYQTLESRQLLATVTYNPSNALLIIDGTSLNDNVTINELPLGFIEVSVVGGSTGQYDQTIIEEITFDGYFGDDVITNNTDVPLRAYGHAGNDTITGGSSSDFVNGGPGMDVINTGDGGDEVYGHDDNDIIDTGSGDDFILGGFGDDQIIAGPGNDLVGGDWGNDTIYGGDGDDNLRGFSGDDIIYGGSGVDLMYSQYGDDVMYGGPGEDRVRGGPGMDTLHGGDDDDYIQGEQDDDIHYGDAGDDTIIGFTGDDFLDGGEGNDLLYGQQDNDEMHGGPGNDVLRGDVGDDLAYGGDGNDYSRLDSGNDTFYGEGGNDRVFGGDGSDQLFGGSGDDDLRGENGDDFLRGNDGVDQLQGGADNDNLFGGLVEDDTLTGNAGLDRFHVRSTDTVTDQSATDDARLVFVDDTSTWTEAELENLDLAFTQLFSRTNNNRLLQDSVPSGDLTFYKSADLGGSAGINYLTTTTYQEFIGGQWVTTVEYEREIHLLDWDETNQTSNEFYQDVLIHEVAHNWDDEFELVAANSNLSGAIASFRALSGWTDTPQGAGYSVSNDGEWWYLDTAVFEDNYGRTNPFEDFAVAWEYYFSGDPVTQQGFQDKIDFMDTIFDQL